MWKAKPPWKISKTEDMQMLTFSEQQVRSTLTVVVFRRAPFCDAFPFLVSNSKALFCVYIIRSLFMLGFGLGVVLRLGVKNLKHQFVCVASRMLSILKLCLNRYSISRKLFRVQLLPLREFRVRFCTKIIPWVWLRVFFFWTLACIFEGLIGAVYEVSKFCPGLFHIWIKMSLKFIQQFMKIGPRGSQERQHRSRGYPRRGSDKQVATKTRYQTNLSKWFQNRSQHLKQWCILDDIF